MMNDRIEVRPIAGGFETGWGVSLPTQIKLSFV